MRFDNRPLLYLAVVFLSVACGVAATADRGASTAAESPNDVLAEVDGTAVRRNQLDPSVDERLVQLRRQRQQEEYDVLRQALDDMINKQLLEKEAKARGVTADAVIKADVEEKLTRVSAAEVASFYEENKGRMGGRPKEQALPEIEHYLNNQRRTDQRQRFEAELRRKSKVSFKLEPPRVDVEVPKGAPSLGPASAPVTIVEFTDYQCPYCQRAQSTVDEIVAQYGSQVRLVSRDYPLDFHERAKFASRAARCAAEQNKFWEYHQDLLRQPTDYSDDDLGRRALSLKLDGAAFKTCLASDRHDAAIKADEEAGRRLGVSGTPAFFINGRMIAGARPKAQFASVIDEELQRTSGAAASR